MTVAEDEINEPSPSSGRQKKSWRGNYTKTGNSVRPLAWRHCLIGLTWKPLSGEWYNIYIRLLFIYITASSTTMRFIKATHTRDLVYQLIAIVCNRIGCAAAHPQREKEKKKHQIVPVDRVDGSRLHCNDWDLLGGENNGSLEIAFSSSAVSSAFSLSFFATVQSESTMPAT